MGYGAGFDPSTRTVRPTVRCEADRPRECGNYCDEDKRDHAERADGQDHEEFKIEEIERKEKAECCCRAENGKCDS